MSCAQLLPGTVRKEKRGWRSQASLREARHKRVSEYACIRIEPHGWPGYPWLIPQRWKNRPGRVRQRVPALASQNEKGQLLFKEFFEDEKSKSDGFLFPPPKYSPISKTWFGRWMMIATSAWTGQSSRRCIIAVEMTTLVRLTGDFNTSKCQNETPSAFSDTLQLFLFFRIRASSSV